MRAHAVVWLGLVVLSAIGRAKEPPTAAAFRVRPYLQNPAPDAMTIRRLSDDGTPGTVRIAGRELVSAPGTILTWEHREYADVVTFDCLVKEPLP